MKKIALIIFAVLLYVFSYCQQSALSKFLDKDLTQLMQHRIDSLSKQLYDLNEELDTKTEGFEDLERVTPEIINFLVLLHKLEDNLPLNNQDSMFVLLNASPSPQHPDTIFIEDYAFMLITKNDSAFLDSYPKLKQLFSGKKLLFFFSEIARASAPAIELPPMPSATANKQKTAKALLEYIYDLSSKCNVASNLVSDYFKIEKTKTQSGDLDKIIELRRKFSVFIQENYCNK